MVGNRIIHVSGIGDIFTLVKFDEKRCEWIAESKRGEKIRVINWGNWKILENDAR